MEGNYIVGTMRRFCGSSSGIGKRQTDFYTNKEVKLRGLGERKAVQSHYI